MFTPKKILLLVVLLLVALLAVHDGKGQRSEAFRVLEASGTIAYRSSANMAWKKIDGTNPNPVLNAAYEVKLTNQSLLVLEPAGRTPIVVQGYSGVVQVSRLVQSATRSASNEVVMVLGRYFQSQWRNLTQQHQTIDSYAQGYMKQKGGVRRGCGIPLMLIPDYGAALTADTSLVFVWKRDPYVQRYTLALYDNSDEKSTPFYSTETADTTLVFTLDKPFIKRETIYYWSVFPIGAPNCARYTLRLVKSDALRKLQETMTTLDTQLWGNTALTAFTKATLYEENYFYAEAHKAYVQATHLSPANSLFRDGLALFLARRGLTEQAKTVLGFSYASH